MKIFTKSFLKSSIIFLIFAGYNTVYGAKPFYKTALLKDNLTYSWTALYNYDFRKNNFSYNIGLNGKSQFYRNSMVNNYSNDAADLKLLFSYRSAKNLSYTSELKGNIYNNSNLDLQYSKIKQNNKASIKFSPGFILSPALGTIYENKYNHQETAFLYGWESSAQMPKTNVNNFFSGNYSSYFYNFKQRKNSEHVVNIQYGTEFSPGSGDSLYASYNSLKKYEYYDRELNREKIDMKETYVSNTLYSELFSHIKMLNHTEFREKYFSQDREDKFNSRSENFLANTLTLSRQKQHITWLFSFFNSMQINDLSEKIKEDGSVRENNLVYDNESMQTAFSQKLVYRPSTKHTLNWHITYAKLEYNTPDSTSNFDDRDEIRLFNGLGYLYQITPRLSLSFASGINYFHQIFIYKEKSALNKEEKVIYLATNAKYREGKLQNTLGSSVNSYYLTYDFTPTSNMVNRKLTISDTMAYRLFPQTVVTLMLKYQVEEIGNLNWEKFAESITRENYYRYFIFYFKHNITNFIYLKPGFSYITRNDYSYLPEKEKVRSYVNMNFWLQGIYNFGKQGYISGKINKFYYNNSGNSGTAYFRGNLEVLWYF